MAEMGAAEASVNDLEHNFGIECIAGDMTWQVGDLHVYEWHWDLLV